MDFLAGGINLVASFVVGNKRRFGFLLHLLADSIWAYVAIKYRIYGLLLVVLPAMAISIRNYRRWRLN